MLVTALKKNLDNTNTDFQGILNLGNTLSNGKIKINRIKREKKCHNPDLVEAFYYL